MLNPVSTWRHVVVALVVPIAPAAVALGLIGGGVYPERFDAKQVAVWPAGGEAVRFREVVDQDFGNADRHGYERNIPTDGGGVTDVDASSPDANADVGISDFGSYVRIRLGDADVTFDGQHRYVLEYTLPDVQLSSGFLRLDIIGTDESFQTGRFEVVVLGFELADTRCHTGPFGAIGGCTLTGGPGEYRVVLEPLAPGDGVSVEGRIVSMTPTDDPGLTIPPLPDRRDVAVLPLAVGTAALGATGAIGAFLLARRRGRNEVSGMGAADAAYAGKGTGTFEIGPTRKVSDAELADMATIEFVPPEGIHPWQGAMLLREKVDADTVGAWFAEQIARERLLIEGGSTPSLSAGPRLSEAPDEDRTRIDGLIGGLGHVSLGKYQPRMATLWKALTKHQQNAAKKSGWWSGAAAGESVKYPLLVAGPLAVVAAAVGIAIWQKWWDHELFAIGLGLALPAVVAGALYAPLLHARSAMGSAMALRVESFRRFLAASEGNHVEWAWQRGLLREYSAWAVALGAADAWGDAVKASGVPQAEVSSAMMPMMVYTYSRSFASSHTAPSKSGSGSSFSSFSGGGFSGGGFGGGSSGSW